jgi:hypothetical protein
MQSHLWVVPLKTTLPKSKEKWTQFDLIRKILLSLIIIFKIILLIVYLQRHELYDPKMFMG